LQKELEGLQKENASLREENERLRQMLGLSVVPDEQTEPKDLFLKPEPFPRVDTKSSVEERYISFAASSKGETMFSPFIGSTNEQGKRDTLPPGQITTEKRQRERRNIFL